VGGARLEEKTKKEFLEAEMQGGRENEATLQAEKNRKLTLDREGEHLSGHVSPRKSFFRISSGPFQMVLIDKKLFGKIGVNAYRKLYLSSI